MWDDTMSSLKLKLCQEQTMHVGQQYAFSFVVTNPQHDQESPRIMIEASGDFVNMLPAPLVKSDAAILGISNGASPLKVVVPLFTSKTMAQSTPISSVSNVITVTLKSTIDLSNSMSATITISNLHGLVRSGSTISMVDVAGQAKMSDLMCFGPTPKLTVWDQQKSHILLTVCAGATLKHSIDYVFAFTITNPGKDQDSPPIAVGASCSMAVIPAMPMDKPNEYVVGVANGSDPLKIVVPIFNDKTVSQSTPLPGFDNTIRLFLRSSINLAAEDESVITISGFTGATSDETSSVKVLKNGADVVGLFCVGDTAGDANYGVWDGGLGSLVFTIC